MGRGIPERRGAKQLGVCVWAHAVIVGAHFAAHVGADVWLAWPAALYISAVIIAGPFVGLWLSESGHGVAGASVVATCMAGALAFGVLNHFVWPGIDHVTAIAGGAWQLPFRVTAAALAASEAAGIGIGALTVRNSWRQRRTRR
jgi:cytochrome bd-type quinol oxidase subunit 2